MHARRYNIGILSSILVHPGWQDVQNHPPPSIRGVITATYYLGTWVSYVFISRPLCDYLGRRYGAMSGTFILAIGAALQAGCTGSHAFAMMVSGRIVCGMGVAIVSTSVPLYQSEISPAEERGKFVTMNHVGFIAGLAAGLWVGYGMTFWTSEAGVYYGWRVSILLQLVPAFTFAGGLPFLPESPRWLVEKGRTGQASRVLHWLRHGSFTPREITRELAEMQRAVERHPAAGWKSLFTEPPLFARLWRATLLHFMAQMAGATAMKYYLPTLLKALGLSTRIALMAGAIEMTLKIGMTVIEMLIIDRLGRRLTLVVGCIAMAIAMLVSSSDWEHPLNSADFCRSTASSRLRFQTM
jgi:MFS family permease